MMSPVGAHLQPDALIHGKSDTLDSDGDGDDDDTADCPEAFSPIGKPAGLTGIGSAIGPNAAVRFRGGGYSLEIVSSEDTHGPDAPGEYPITPTKARFQHAALASDQARIMYTDNAAAAKAGKSVRAYRGYGYGTAGEAVDAVYTANAERPAAEAKALMASEVERWIAKGVVTSKHCVGRSTYDRNNILDIPCSGIGPAHRIALSNYFNKHVHSSAENPLINYPKRKLIDRVIVERACWHVEITQNQEPLPSL